MAISVIYPVGSAPVCIAAYCIGGTQIKAIFFYKQVMMELLMSWAQPLFGVAQPEIQILAPVKNKCVRVIFQLACFLTRFYSCCQIFPIKIECLKWPSICLICVFWLAFNVKFTTTTAAAVAAATLEERYLSSKAATAPASGAAQKRTRKRRGRP